MEPAPRQLLHYATLAPSGHNTQPWQFSTDRDTVRIFPDLRRRLPVVDPDDHALYISLGCALENLLIAAARHRLEAVEPAQLRRATDSRAPRAPRAGGQLL